ncbi:MAG: hypothetical protein J4N79_08805 [Chloroflexi bacterium]|nr:hypothetical protein [Chloroflexota bacterium]
MPAFFMSLVSFRMVFASNQRFTFSVSDWRPDISLPVALWLGLDTHIPGHCRPAHRPSLAVIPKWTRVLNGFESRIFGEWVLLPEAIYPAVNILVFTTGWIGGLSDFAGQANSSDPGSFVFTVFFYLGILLFFIQAAIGWLNIKKEILFLNQSSSPLGHLTVSSLARSRLIVPIRTEN